MGSQHCVLGGEGENRGSHHPSVSAERAVKMDGWSLSPLVSFKRDLLTFLT